MNFGVCKTALVPHEQSVLAWPPLGRARRATRQFVGPEEPRLEELLADPMVARLMCADGVGYEELAALISEAREKLSRS